MQQNHIFNKINEIVLNAKNKQSDSNYELTEKEKIVSIKLKGLQELFDMKVLSEEEFEKQRKELYERAIEAVNVIQMIKSNKKGEIINAKIDEDFKRDFFSLVDKVNLSLMEDRENFYGYFLFQMGRNIRFDITSATSVNFKGAKYIIYFSSYLYV